MILTGAKYALPAAQEKADPSDRTALSCALEHVTGDLSGAIFTRVAGIAPHTAEKIAQSYTGGSLAEHVFGYLFSDELSPRVGERDFYARETAGIPFPTLAAAQTYFYDNRSKKKTFESRRKRLQSACAAALKKQEKRLAQTIEKREQCKDCELLRIKGELLTAHLYEIGRNAEGVELYNYYDGSNLKITLDRALSPAQNAQAYFKRYRKQKRTAEFLAPQEEETRREIEYLHTLLAAIDRKSVV